MDVSSKPNKEKKSLMEKVFRKKSHKDGEIKTPEPQPDVLTDAKNPSNELKTPSHSPHKRKSSVLSHVNTSGFNSHFKLSSSSLKSETIEQVSSDSKTTINLTSTSKSEVVPKEISDTKFENSNPDRIESSTNFFKLSFKDLTSKNKDKSIKKDKPKQEKNRVNKEERTAHGKVSIDLQSKINCGGFKQKDNTLYNVVSHSNSNKSELVAKCLQEQATQQISSTKEDTCSIKKETKLHHQTSQLQEVHKVLAEIYPAASTSQVHESQFPSNSDSKEVNKILDTKYSKEVMKQPLHGSEYIHYDTNRPTFPELDQNDVITVVRSENEDHTTGITLRQFTNLIETVITKAMDRNMAGASSVGLTGTPRSAAQQINYQPAIQSFNVETQETGGNLLTATTCRLPTYEQLVSKQIENTDSNAETKAETELPSNDSILNTKPVIVFEHLKGTHPTPTIPLAVSQKTDPFTVHEHIEDSCHSPSTSTGIRTRRKSQCVLSAPKFHTRTTAQSHFNHNDHTGLNNVDSIHNSVPSICTNHTGRNGEMYGNTEYLPCTENTMSSRSVESLHSPIPKPLKLVSQNNSKGSLFRTSSPLSIQNRGYSKEMSDVFNVQQNHTVSTNNWSSSTLTNRYTMPRAPDVTISATENLQPRVSTNAPVNGNPINLCLSKQQDMREISTSSECTMPLRVENRKVCTIMSFNENGQEQFRLVPLYLNLHESKPYNSEVPSNVKTLDIDVDIAHCQERPDIAVAYFKPVNATNKDTGILTKYCDIYNTDDSKVSRTPNAHNQVISETVSRRSVARRGLHDDSSWIQSLGGEHKDSDANLDNYRQNKSTPLPSSLPKARSDNGRFEQTGTQQSLHGCSKTLLAAVAEIERREYLTKISSTSRKPTTPNICLMSDL